jgi:hypothetical protein
MNALFGQFGAERDLAERETSDRMDRAIATRSKIVWTSNVM